MSKKKKTYQVTEKKSNRNSFTLSGGYVPTKIDAIHEHLQEVKRGCGVVQSKKVYNRKKNNRAIFSDDCSFFMLVFQKLIKGYALS